MYRQQVLNFKEIILVVQDSSAKTAIIENFLLYGRIIALLTYYYYMQELMSRPKGGEGASDCRIVACSMC